MGRGGAGQLNLLGPIWAICSALAWGTGDFAGGLATRRGHVATTLLISQAVGFLVCLGLAIASREAFSNGAALVWAVIGGASGILGVGSFYAALSRGAMSLVAPLTALIAATIPAVVGIVNGSAPGPLLLIGMVVALSAVAVISLPDSAARPGADRPAALPAHGLRSGQLGLILLAGLGFAGFFLGLAESHRQGGGLWWPLLVVRVAGLVMTASGVLVLRATGRLSGVRPGRKSLPLAVVAGTGDLGGNLFYLLAVSETTLPTAVVLSSLYPVQTTLLARLILGERLTAVRLAGVGIAIVGIVLVSLGSVGS